MAKWGMARPIEKVALELMKALQEERERNPDLTKSRTVGDIAGKICKSQEEFDRVFRFITDRRLLDCWDRYDGKGKVAYPNQAGFAWMDSQAESKPSRTKKHRVTLPRPIEKAG